MFGQAPSRRLTSLVLFGFVAGLFALAQTAQAQDTGAPKWGEFLKQFKKDRLLKKPYHMDPEEGVKGLASKIRARELDIPNRIKAVKYLKDLDCVAFPEAKKMLVEVMMTDKWEPVRYEAARGLRDMLSRHSCNPNAENAEMTKLEVKIVGPVNEDDEDEKGRGKDAGRCPKCNNPNCPNCPAVKRGDPTCHCRSCCDPETLTKLAEVAYGMDDKGCFVESSERVREMAKEAIAACGIPCRRQPYYVSEEAGPMAEERGPSAIESTGPAGNGEIVPDSGVEVVPPGASAGPQMFPITHSRAMPALSEIGALNEYCIVSLKRGVKVFPDKQFSSTYQGRIYHFASAECRDEFTANPADFAVCFGGCDPVQFVKTREAEEGRYLVLHEDRFYMFTTRDNYEAFLADPARYTPRSATSANAQ